MTDLPPPPPLAGSAPGVPDATQDAELAAWEAEVDAALARMTETISKAIEEHDAGRLDLAGFQKQCLAAGTARVGDALVLWDWVNGRVFVYDGFQMVDLTGIES